MAEEKKSTLKEKAEEELRLMLVITAFLAAVFVSFLTYKRIVSREFGVTSFHYGFALIEALIVAKVILIGKALKLGEKKQAATPGWAVLRASLVYGALVGVFAVLEHTIEGLVHGKGLSASLGLVFEQGIDEILARTLVLFVAFIPFFAFWELDRELGEGKIYDLFFRRRAQAQRG